MLSFVKFFSRVNALKMHDSMYAILRTYVNLTSLVQKYVNSVNAVDFARDLFFFSFSFFLIWVVV